MGIPSAMALGRFVSSRLYGIEGRDPWTAVATLILLTAVSAAAGVIPAHRASRIDPILALRYEKEKTAEIAKIAEKNVSLRSRRSLRFFLA